MKSWRRGWLQSGVVCFFVSAAVLVGVRECAAIGCPDAQAEQDLEALTSTAFDDWTETACTTPDQNLDGRVSAADLVARLLAVDAPPAGPLVTFVGLATADGRVLVPVGTQAGLPVFQRPAGSGFLLVVEGRAGASRRPVGIATFQPDSGSERRPDLQILTSRALGDGSPEVCSGGVPAVVPPDYRPERFVSDALNDLGCNFALATGACTVNTHGQPALVTSTSQIQFCATVARSWAFPPGDTLLTVRLRDVAGNLGPARQLVVRVGDVLPSPTPTHRAPSSTPTATPTRSLRATPTPSSTLAAPTQSPSATRTQTSPTATPRATTPLPTNTATPTSTARRSPTATFTPTPGRPTPTFSSTVRVSATPTATRTRTITPLLATPTRTVPSTPSRTPTRTYTPTAGTGSGPVVTFVGITRADDTPVEPSGTTPDGVPIFQRPTGAGFNIVIEGRPGASGVPVGSVTFRENGPPDLQVLVSRPLGNGSPEVCDRLPPRIGGVPAVDPPDFSDRPTVIDALNDLGCRFLDGAGQPRGRGRNDACILKPDGGFDFARSNSTIQFCGFIDVATRFPDGEVRLTIRLRDERGEVGPAVSMIVRIGP